MASAPKGSTPPIFDLKSTSLAMVALVLKTVDLDELRAEFDRRYGDTPNFFSDDALVIDLAQVADDDVAPAPAGGRTPVRQPAVRPDFERLIALLNERRLRPLAVRGGSPLQHTAARAAGLTEVAGDLPDPVREAPPREVVREVVQVQEVVREVVREVPVPGATLVVDKPLRSGQQVYAKGGDLVVLAMVNHGAELIADGSIHVYAPLRGKAIAGARGNADARIFSTCLEPELISIAGTYRTSENPLPDEVRGKPAQVRLEGDKLVMEPLKL